MLSTIIIIVRATRTINHIRTNEIKEMIHCGERNDNNAVRLQCKRLLCVELDQSHPSHYEDCGQIHANQSLGRGKSISEMSAI